MLPELYSYAYHQYLDGSSPFNAASAVRAVPTRMAQLLVDCSLFCVCLKGFCCDLMFLSAFGEIADRLSLIFGVVAFAKA